MQDLVRKLEREGKIRMQKVGFTQIEALCFAIQTHRNIYIVENIDFHPTMAEPQYHRY
jgi:hypothetical protein